MTGDNFPPAGGVLGAAGGAAGFFMRRIETFMHAFEFFFHLLCGEEVILAGPNDTLDRGVGGLSVLIEQRFVHDFNVTFQCTSLLDRSLRESVHYPP